MSNKRGTKNIEVKREDTFEAKVRAELKKKDLVNGQADHAVAQLNENLINSLETWRDLSEEEKKKFPLGLKHILDRMAFPISAQFETDLRKVYQETGKTDLIESHIARLIEHGVMTIVDWKKLTDEQKKGFPVVLSNTLDEMAEIKKVFPLLS